MSSYLLRSAIHQPISLASLRLRAPATTPFRGWQAPRSAARAIEKNPQNVPNPVVMPSKELSPEGAVTVQLDALRENDDPWGNHGIQTAYEFGYDIGGLDASMYFGFRKDLYHFDHFLGAFGTKLGGLLNLQNYNVTHVDSKSDEEVEVAVAVTDAVGRAHEYVFTMRFKKHKSAWYTYSVVKVE